MVDACSPPSPPNLNGAGVALPGVPTTLENDETLNRKPHGISHAGSKTQVDLKDQILTMSREHKVDLKIMIEQYTSELISAIDSALTRRCEDLCDDVGNAQINGEALEVKSVTGDTQAEPHLPVEDIADPQSQSSANTLTKLKNSFTPAKLSSGFMFAVAPPVEKTKEQLLMEQLLPQDTAFWDTVVGIVIILNGIVMMIEYEWKGWVSGVQLGQVDKEDMKWQNAQIVFDVFEHLFTIIFIVELIIKLFIYKRSFFHEVLNLFDFFLVAISVLDMYIITLIVGNGSDALDNLTVLRVMRMARLMRTFRMLRTLKLFSGLRVLIKSVGSCVLSLTWSMVLLTIFMMIAAIMMCSMVEEFVLSEGNEYDQRVWVWVNYGTSLRATYTMYEITMSGCWPNYVRPLLNEVSWLYSIFFLIYVTFVVFAVIRIITAIFLKETMDAANSDADMVITDRARKKQHYLSKLEKVFKAADESDNGKLSEDEFNAAMDVPIVKSYLQALELDVHEGQALFQLLDDGDGEIVWEEFIKGVSRLKGQARSIDLVAIQMDAQAIKKRLDELFKVIARQNARSETKDT